MKTYYAHSMAGKSEEYWQTLDEHLANTAQLASAMTSVFGAESFGKVLGYLHDYGKATQLFQKRLRGSIEKVDHSTAGGQSAIRIYGKAYGHLLAYAIIGHHAGLPDGGSTAALGSLTDRLQKKLPEQPVVSDHVVKLLMNTTIKYPFSDRYAAKGFSVAFLIRMIYSALVDADSLDTELFCSPDVASLRAVPPNMAALAALIDEKLTQRFAHTPNTMINSHRAQILAQSTKAASLPRGIYKLSVPTGGGKTFASMSFALHHAAKQPGMRRVIYAIPYTSIIEQNAAQFKTMLGEENVLEHHSNIDIGTEENEDNQTSLRIRLTMENWDAPVIVTTNVQFFESFYSNRRSRCRKLHNIAGSVIILDEAQMLDVDFLRPCLAILEELVRHYNCTVVLCTATQPSLDQFFSNDLKPVEIMDNPRALYEAFRKVCVSNAGTLSVQGLASCLLEEQQVLCIVNTRGNASELYHQIKSGGDAYHLSARMTAVHRSQKIAQIKTVLRDGRPCRVISTQLIEAGVDIDFPVVYRAMAGIDSIVQAAGRCNREGLRPHGGHVHVFSLEGTRLMGWFSKTSGYAREILEIYPNDPLSPEAVDMYFSNLYTLEQSGLDRHGILGVFNEGDGARDFLFPFKQVADMFKLIEDNTFTLIVPHDKKSLEIAAKFQAGTASRNEIRQLGRYSVQVYAHELAELQRAGSVTEIDSTRVLIDLSLYDVIERGLLHVNESSYLTDTYIVS